jgi:acyl dehydratase
MARRFFEEITDGERLKCHALVFTREEIIEFAKKYDPQPFHIDERAAEDSIFCGLIASSLHTISACTHSVVKAQRDVAILSGVGM